MTANNNDWRFLYVLLACCAAILSIYVYGLFDLFGLI